jgi:hypothetical protein
MHLLHFLTNIDVPFYYFGVLDHLLLLSRPLDIVLPLVTPYITLYFSLWTDLIVLQPACFKENSNFFYRSPLSDSSSCLFWQFNILFMN